MFNVRTDTLISKLEQVYKSLSLFFYCTLATMNTCNFQRKWCFESMWDEFANSLSIKVYRLYDYIYAGIKGIWWHICSTPLPSIKKSNIHTTVLISSVCTLPVVGGSVCSPSALSDFTYTGWWGLYDLKSDAYLWKWLLAWKRNKWLKSGVRLKAHTKQLCLISEIIFKICCDVSFMFFFFFFYPPFGHCLSLMMTDTWRVRETSQAAAAVLYIYFKDNLLKFKE